MKTIFIFLLLAAAGNIVAQDRDFNLGLSAVSSDKRLISVGEHVSLYTSNLQLSTVERQILDLESRECKALLKRDTLALREIWTRDFTLDQPMDKVIDGNNVLPYYIFISRMIENVNPVGSLVFTSGYEVVKQLTPSGKLGDPLRQTFFHTWTNKNGVWKLSTKTH